MTGCYLQACALLLRSRIQVLERLLKPRAFQWRSSSHEDRNAFSLSFDNRYADRKFKAVFRTSETKNGNVHYYFKAEFKFWNDC